MIRRYAPACRQISRTVFLAGAMSIAAQAGLHAAEHPLVAPAPLVIDPIFGNAGDPTAVFHRDAKSLWVGAA
ncbi:MAG: hypothetical protein MUE50_16295 [Pirellulaceae bacterium]|jgi:hypothetical protein|nr:hypothetical protein [Pirellulaceae bacterium]